MYVRMTYATGDPAKIDEAIDGLVAEAPKLLADQPGYRGFRLFADRELGKLATASWWETEEAERSSDEQLAERRGQLLAPFAASAVTEVWEVAAYAPARAQAGGGLRLGRLEFDPAKVDQAVRAFQQVLPKFQAIPGNAGAAMLLDRARGRAVVGTLWADRAALAASRGPQAAARSEGVRAGGFRLLSLEEFELVLADYR
ncbi:antibiotic biosynthesis monooxygenase [Kitasatospora sp. RB6PN24]|uniref:antibiotic biosynthesis monooxygenase family protein n=1 Tax=Kitasatospora humi TaxID=2893891 RepID=UPI001E35A260|nr:antibiotic biosynthesis monooxygenase [Kitasatospora humi]MCC9306669.1 antibiotic biosynthesis monooxygenase [Kitasatospora humi]